MASVFFTMNIQSLIATYSAAVVGTTIRGMRCTAAEVTIEPDRCWVRVYLGTPKTPYPSAENLLSAVFHDTVAEAMVPYEDLEPVLLGQRKLDFFLPDEPKSPTGAL